MIIPRSLGTHSGTFHADEVTACALLLVYDLIDQDKIIRTRDTDLLSNCEFVCDVGGEYNPSKKRFDHHQVSYKGDFSSAGMIWLYLCDQNIVTKSVYYFLNHLLIQGVDAHDNGRVTFEPGVCTFSHIISNFVPIHYDASPEEQDEAFHRALDFVVGHLKRALDRFTYVLGCRDAVKTAMADNKDYLYFSKSLPWIDAFFELRGEDHPAKFVIMPSGGSWKLRGIPPSSSDRMKVRSPLPDSWGGLLDKDLKEVSKIPGAIFCHKGLFISVWETEEDAFKAMEYALADRKVK
jgi:uncharacterized UPF0160 family protein